MAEQLVAQAREKGIELVGPEGLLSQLTKRVLEAALEAEMSDHLGYDKHDPVGRNVATPVAGAVQATDQPDRVTIRIHAEEDEYVDAVFPVIVAPAFVEPLPEPEPEA